jgi:MSHA pilin protein MshA
MRISKLGNTQQVNKQKGFTLIELVVVIVILGILAVTAAPKFIDITSDAKGAVLDAGKAALNSATDMVHAKAIVAGKVKAVASAETITFNSQTIALNFGWPTNASIGFLVDLEGMTETTTGNPAVNTGIFEHDAAVDGATCRITYDSSSASTTKRPTVVVLKSTC